MRAVTMSLTLALCVGAASAQTFVPRFERPPVARNDSPSVFGSKNDLETSMGRVAEAPKLMPTGASASMSPDEELAPSASPVFLPGLSGLAFVAVLLAAGSVSWRLRTKPVRRRTDR